jgi:hypothetical protein
MATERQIAANRLNARKSTGPRSRAGKKRVSRNAYKHGLSLSVSSNERVSKRINELARQIVGEDEDAVCFQLARSVAEAHFALARVRQTKVALIERIRAYGAFKSGPEFRLGVRQCIWLTKEMFAGRQPQPVLSRKFVDAIILRAAPPAIRGEPEGSAEAIRRILRVLIKLERYEGRATSRGHAAVRQLVERHCLCHAKILR